MIVGIGVDILSVARLENLRGKYDDSFFKKTFTKAEYETGLKRPDPIIYFTQRFAAKEAVFKALNVKSAAFRFNEVETLNDDSGKPYVVLHGEAKRLRDEAGIKRILISLSSDGGYAIAYAVCEI